MIAAGIAAVAARQSLPQRRLPRTCRCDYAGRDRVHGIRDVAAAPVAGGYLLLPERGDPHRRDPARRGRRQPAEEIQLCDAKGCTPIAAPAVLGGAFVNIAQDGGAHFAKVGDARHPAGHPPRRLPRSGGAPADDLATYVGSRPALARPAAGRN